ncbi:MAG: hypothetical protein J6D28_05605 [Bacilli bacterium]|nr:hypothetical protein [Bacilli bacterium]
MNKKEVIKKLGEVTNLSEEKCIIINDILEEHFIIGKNNKEKIISDISEKLETTREESENIYELAMSIIGSGIKDKLKHPFC